MNETLGIILMLIVFGCLFYYLHIGTKLADEITKGLEGKK